MVKSVFEEMSKDNPKNHFSVGITDDVTFNSLAFNSKFRVDQNNQVRALFLGTWRRRHRQRKQEFDQDHR